MMKFWYELWKTRKSQTELTCVWNANFVSQFNEMQRDKNERTTQIKYTQTYMYYKSKNVKFNIKDKCRKKKRHDRWIKGKKTNNHFKWISCLCFVSMYYPIVRCSLFSMTYHTIAVFSSTLKYIKTMNQFKSLWT